MKKQLLISVIAITMASCASQPNDIASTYVSPLKYDGLECGQISAEMGYINQRVYVLHESLKKKADNDAVQMGVGMLLFWPTLFFLEGGDGPEATEYATLKGEFEALRSTAVNKNCNIANLPATADALVVAKRAEEEGT